MKFNLSQFSISETANFTTSKTLWNITTLGIIIAPNNSKFQLLLDNTAEQGLIKKYPASSGTTGFTKCLFNNLPAVHRLRHNPATVHTHTHTHTVPLASIFILFPHLPSRLPNGISSSNFPPKIFIFISHVLQACYMY